MLLNIATVIAMLVIGWVVWITVQRREKSDQSFQEKLDRDDERARKGREAEAAYRQAQRDRE
jgi:Flp pilus assembly protein TadB